jgi:hypothetical protein
MSTFGIVMSSIIAVIEVYYWFIWFPQNKNSLREYKDVENYINYERKRNKCRNT